MHIYIPMQILMQSICSLFVCTVCVGGFYFFARPRPTDANKPVQQGAPFKQCEICGGSNTTTDEHLNTPLVLHVTSNWLASRNGGAVGGAPIIRAI